MIAIAEQRGSLRVAAYLAATLLLVGRRPGGRFVKVVEVSPGLGARPSLD